MTASIDPVELTAALVRCKSATPAGADVFDIVEAPLRDLGFSCTRLVFEGDENPPVINLFAKLGEGRPHIAFCGHLDTVPAGPLEAWLRDPFAGVIADGALWGRGAADMKSAVAAFISAVARHLESAPAQCRGAISLLLTGDEEGPSVNGTKKLLAWADERGEVFDACIVGEPTSVEALGDMAKIGRRGSLTGSLAVKGRIGHTAYPDRADNAVHKLNQILAAWLAEPIDGGTSWFQPSNLQVTRIVVDNEATNVVPGSAMAFFNIRYNDSQNRESLDRWLMERAVAVTANVELRTHSSGDAFVTEPGPLAASMIAAAEAVTGRTPVLSTSGGTSDARFVTAFAPVIEFGLTGATIHRADEHARLDEIRELAEIYSLFIARMRANTQ